MKFTPVLLSGLLAGAQAASIPARSVNEKRHELSAKWEKREALESDAVIPVRIALKQQNLENGMDYLMEVSDPSSAKYGKHYTPEEVTELFAPKDETVQTVKAWLIKHGISAKSITSSKSRGFLDFTTTVAQLETMIEGKYHVYAHTSGKGQQITSEKYVLPDEISSHVDFIHPAMSVSNKKASSQSEKRYSSPATIKDPPKKYQPIPAQMVQKLKAAQTSTQYCADYVTPQCLKAIYNITDGKLANPNNRLGIFESDDEVPLQSDLAAFYAQFAQDIPPTVGPKFDLIDFNGHKPDPSQAVGEAALDFDMAQPILFPQSTVLFQSKDNFNPANGTEGFFNQFLDAIDGSYCTFESHGEKGDDPVVDGKTPNEMCGAFKPTHVISFSYGWAESEYPAGYVERQCDEFMKLGLQGTTLVFSSGDGGVAGGHGGDCLGEKGNIFNPQIGAACPYVTTVGSTFLASGNEPGDAEQATTSFASGGGFSNVWPTPRYQQDAVGSYFNNHDPGFPFYSTTQGKIPLKGKGIYNRAGRGYPDIAAMGDNGVVVLNSQVGRSGGTSMSAPIVASIFTRINEERIAKGKAPIGFANPALYANPKMFHDITIGDMNAGGEGFCLGKGFKTAPGWDPVSGLGTPNYPAMLKYFMSAV